jgi:hypothetical protein
MHRPFTFPALGDKPTAPRQAVQAPVNPTVEIAVIQARAEYKRHHCGIFATMYSAFWSLVFLGVGLVLFFVFPPVGFIVGVIGFICLGRTVSRRSESQLRKQTLREIERLS